MNHSSPPCRCCGKPLTHVMVDLGMSPPCESFLPADRIDEMEAFFPLRVLVCDQCWLVQLREYVRPDDIFVEYAYFSSYSDSWVQHAKNYVHAMVDRLGLNRSSMVVELASNDGYLLQHFVPLGVPILGVEPAANVAKAAEARSVPTRVDFFGVRLAQELVAEGVRADLIAGNNVLAQVPDLNDFVAGIAILLVPKGTVTLEFPHLQATMEGNQFDQIYHEHFSYFSLLAIDAIAARHDLVVYDVEELPTHGGSLRVYLRHAAHDDLAVTDAVVALRRREVEAGYADLAVYRAFGAKVAQTKRRILAFLVDAKERGKTVVGYGAPGKGNTLLNYCGIRTDFIDFLVDRNPYKHGRLAPGTHIPIHPVERLDEVKPDYVFILPWNLKTEITRQMRHIGSWGGRFVVPIPELTVVDPAEVVA